MTPRQFDFLAKRKSTDERTKDYRSGIIAALLANQMRDPKKRAEPFEPSHFFPSLSVGRKIARATGPMEMKQLIMEFRRERGSR